MTVLDELDEWRRAGATFQFGAHRIFYRDVGEGPPVLALHGFPTASFDYARLVPHLAAHHRVVMCDFLGYGFSAKPRGHEFSMFEQADIVQALAAHLGLASVRLLAHDMGDTVATELLRRSAPRFERVVLLNGSVVLAQARPLLVQRLLLHPIVGPLLTGLGLIRRPTFARQFGSVFAVRPPGDEIEAFWRLVERDGGLRVYHRLIQYLRERKEHEPMWLDALARHPAPLALVWGQRDPVARPEVAAAVLERRPDARYVRLDDIGHYPQWEAPERVAAAVLEAFA